MTSWQSYAVKGARGNIRELCTHFRVVTVGVARKRIAMGWSAEDAVLTPNKRSSAKPALGYCQSDS